MCSPLNYTDGDKTSCVVAALKHRMHVRLVAHSVSAIPTPWAVYRESRNGSRTKCRVSSLNG